MPNYLRVASIMPLIEVGNVEFNTLSIIKELNDISKEKVKIAVLSELSITSNSLNDLYLDKDILNESLKSLFTIANKTNKFDMLIFATIPFDYNNKLYEVCAVIYNGKIVLMTPIKNENKIFSYRDNINACVKVYDNISNSYLDIPFISNVNITIDNISNLSIKIDTLLTIDNYYDTTILINPHSMSESIYINDKIDRLKFFSKENNIAIINSNPSWTESSAKDVYFSRAYIFECGEIIAENSDMDKNYLIADIDIDHINATKINNKNLSETNYNTFNIHFNNINEYPIDMNIYRQFNETPYILENNNRYIFSKHIIDMLSVALQKRLMATKTDKVVLGLSGGLDSTLCLFIINNYCEIANIDKSNMIVVTMPCFGTTSNSLKIANELASGLGIKLKNIDIKDSVIKHFNDISHDINNINSTFENAQARERTQVLMDIANDENAIVIGTGDLSETALGFCTYNGDQMSMYNLISSIPKTMVKYILESLSLEYKKNHINTQLSNAIDMLLQSPISPELLPTSDDKTVQFTEKIVGDYLLVDFILYHYLNYNYSIDKIYDLSLRTFVFNNNHKYNKDYIKQCINTFFDRFYKAQFKRNATADSPSIGLKNLDSHNSFYTPGDINICKKII